MNLKELKKELRVLEKQRQEIVERDYESYAQDIIDKTFKEFSAGGKWTNKAKASAEKKFYVYSPFKRFRRLWAGLTRDKGIIAQQVRRGSNAPIQGFASEVGVLASRGILEAYYDSLPFFRKKFFPKQTAWDFRLLFNRIVHDASYFSVKYYMVMPTVWIIQYQATYGVAEYVNKHFGIKFTIEPEIEMEFGVRDDDTFAWNWSMPHLIECIYKTVVDAEALNLLDDTPQKVMQQIMAPYNDPECIKYLQDNYPLLGVRDLDKQIKSAVPDFLKSLKAKASNSTGTEHDEAVKNYRRAKLWFAAP